MTHRHCVAFAQGNVERVVEVSTDESHVCPSDVQKVNGESR